MANVLIEESSLANTAAAIRSMNGSADKYKASQFGDAVKALDVNRPLVVAGTSERFAAFVRSRSLTFVCCGAGAEPTTLCVTDSVTGLVYSIREAGGHITLTEAAAGTRAIQPRLIDSATGIVYIPAVQNGVFCLQEV